MRKVGSKGDILCKYSFKVNNALFTGSVENKDYTIGDTIKILYLLENPEINRDKKFIDEINN